MIRPARIEDTEEILALIYELAVYEKAPEEAKATAAQIKESFFSDAPKVFCEIVEHNGQIAGFAIWFLNYSTWQGLHGIYLEDLFIRPQFRSLGYGKDLLKYLANICPTQLSTSPLLLIGFISSSNSKTDLSLKKKDSWINFIVTNLGSFLFW